MALPKQPATDNLYKSQPDPWETGFSVIYRREIGYVSRDPFSEESMAEVAMRMIGREDTEGTYEYPLPGRGVCEVTIRYRGIDDEEH